MNNLKDKFPINTFTGETQNQLIALVEGEVKEAEKRERKKYRDHLCFVWRWISRLNGDKEHDNPDKRWKEFVGVLVNYPISPYKTGDWFED